MLSILEKYQIRLDDARVQLQRVDRELVFKKTLSCVPMEELNVLTERRDRLNTSIKNFKHFKILK